MELMELVGKYSTAANFSAKEFIALKNHNVNSVDYKMITSRYNYYLVISFMENCTENEPVVIIDYFNGSELSSKFDKYYGFMLEGENDSNNRELYTIVNASCFDLGNLDLRYDMVRNIETGILD